MSTDDDKIPAAEAPTEANDNDARSDESRSPGATDKAADGDKSIGFVILFFILGLAASLVVGWGIFPKLLYSQKQQPIDFNHALHAGLVDNGCASCHFFRADGSFSGVPGLAQCVSCHHATQGESENEARFVAEYVAQRARNSLAAVFPAAGLRLLLPCRPPQKGRNGLHHLPRPHRRIRAFENL